MKIIHKLQQHDLRGRGGAGFPVAFKWLSVLKARLEDLERPVYVICNATEGEPAVKKDMYILRYYPEEVINGIMIALETFDAEKGFIVIKRKNYELLKEKLDQAIGDKPIHIFAEDGGYLCGEETTLLETMEGDRREPRVKPPFPTECGLHGKPTLVNNVESFYYVSKIQKNEYHDTCFYTISGEVKKPGVFELPLSLTLGEVLKNTGNAPKCKFFVQVGGGAAGEIYLPDELDCRLSGAGSIVVYNAKKTKPVELMKQWIKFFQAENCGQCTPCREGVYRLNEELTKKEVDWTIVRAILHTLKDTSFCPLGKSVFTPMMSLLEKVGVGRDLKLKRLKD